MRAVVQDRYGTVEDLTVREVEMPVLADDEVLVRVRAASVHPDVWHMVTGRPYVLRAMGAGLLRPRNRVPGTDVAGYVEAVGSSVSRFRAGDAVFGETLRGFQWHNGGAFAEYVALPAGNLAIKPDNISFEEAAAIPTAGLIVLLNLPRGERLQPGHHVLVNGAGGGVGAIAVQLAKAYGATVTGVDKASKLDMIRSLGADHVIDCTAEDFTRRGELYDVIFDVPGNHPFSVCRRALTVNGTYVLIGHDGFGDWAGRWWGSLPRALGLMVRSRFVRQLPPMDFSPTDKAKSMATLKAFIEAGQLATIVDRTYSLDEVPDAIRHLERGSARGRIIISV